jgi:hypothetical protein
MTTMISEVYEAFRSVGIADDKARSAAEALSADQLATKVDITRMGETLRSETARLGETLRGDIAKLDKQLAVIKWMLGLIIVAAVVPLGRLFFEYLK